MLAATVGSVIWGAGQFSQYGSIRDEYDTLVDLYRAETNYQELAVLKTQMDEKYAEMQSSHDKLGTVVTVIGGIWLLNAVEAAALMPRLPFAQGVTGGPDLKVSTCEGRFSLQLRFEF